MATAAVKKEKKEVRAIARYIRMSRLKVRRILDHIRGKSAAQAKEILSVLPHKAARLAERVLGSAIANASNTHKLNKDMLMITTAVADQAFILKRFRAASRGRAVSIHKKMSHVTIGVKDMAKEST
jgi:large subunit ribosomal protein L22